MSNFYLHAIKATGSIRDIDGSLEDLEGILSTGAIYTRRSLGLVGFGFNGTRYISLSDYDKRFDHIYKDDENLYDYTAYDMYSNKAISIMIDKMKVKAIIPTLVEPLGTSFFSVLKIFGAGQDLIKERMSDLPDEVQVKGNIYEDAFTGITIPSEQILHYIGSYKLRLVYEKIKLLLEKYEYHLGMYNLSDMRPMNTEEDVEDIIKRSH